MDIINEKQIQHVVITLDDGRKVEYGGPYQVEVGKGVKVIGVQISGPIDIPEGYGYDLPKEEGDK